VVLLAFLAWSAFRAGAGGAVVNTGGWSSFVRFWAGMVSPELSGSFLWLTAEAALVTVSFAVLGTALSIVVGAVGALGASELFTGSARRYRGSIVNLLARAVLVVPRSVHEVLWALLVLQVLGFDPLVAVLAIGVPFGAVTAKVFAETIDSADPGPYRAMRASGAPRLVALVYGVIPTVRGELVSYAFYRFECAIRSAAVLGVIGAGGLGFQLDLSFESLRYREIWTLIAALMVLSGSADWWSTRVRRSARRGAPRRSPVGRWSIGRWSPIGRRSPMGRWSPAGRWSLLGVVGLVPVAWWWVGVDPATLWSARTRALIADLIDATLPPRLGPGGWGELLGAGVDTVAMSVVALAIAAGGGLVVGSWARTSIVARLALLLFRAVPAPVWAFLFVLVLFPGPWPGAVALGVYNLGVLGRLFAEAIDERDQGPALAVVALGANRAQTLLYAALPTAGPRIVALALYRWEVIVRETVVVGVVGAGGLGQLINEHLAARDFAAVSGAIALLVAVSVTADLASTGIRRAVR
jgi:phosphonate transport system permease protein